LSRLSALDEALSRAEAQRREAAERKGQHEAALNDLAPSDELALALERARTLAAQERAEFAEAKAAAQNLAREAEAREARRRAIAEERRSWAERRAKADAHIADIGERRAAAEAELATLAEAPAVFLQQRRQLLSELDAAEAARRGAADARAAAETALAEADRAARAALESMGVAREARAASEQRLEGARQARDELLKTIETELNVAPAELQGLASLAAGEAPPETEGVERKLESLKQERERLGAVNLRADEELAEVTASRDKLVSERDDLTEAIKRLRQAIQNLNQEGRERLLGAFEVVNKHFGELFATLFEGGTAELQLIESDDPLEAGLELVARPPGKKPQTLTLLSGGEQALTAMALIFAVFLTNPSPICVLDEVDAPLDDFNVERFCDLLDEMCRRSDTRFVTITHNPITMARMDRLFGVTMAERGVSQIVSVDLAEAERFLEAS
jgi:chromosome segregation protein